MTLDFLQPVLNWVTANPGWTGFLVFLIAMSESLIVVGIIVPGATFMFGFGALIAVGRMDFGTTCLWAVAGAVIGDGLSFAVGRMFKHRLPMIWPFRTHPQWIDQGERFVVKHGGKSVFLGRFVGPLRAIVPAVAGMLSMPYGRFITLNVLSALAWAPMYLIPGMVFAASLELASQVALRLALLLALVLCTLWLTIWVVRQAYRRSAPHLDAWQQALSSWSQRHPLAGHLGATLVDPHHPEARGLALIGALLILSSAVLISSVGFAMGGLPPWPFDLRVHNLFESLRSTWGNVAMMALASLGDLVVVAALGITVGLWLGTRRAWLALLHWMAGIAFGLLTALALSYLVGEPPPFARLVTGWGGLASIHPTQMTVMAGFAAIMIARDASPSWRWLAYATAASLIISVSIARIYLGMQWLSDTLAGLSLGLSWVLLMGIAYRRRPSVRTGSLGLAMVCLVSVTGAGYWNLHYWGGSDLSALQPRPDTENVPTRSWWNMRWSELPPYRIDLGGDSREALEIQWAGSEAEIKRLLRANGWHEAPRLSLAGILATLNPQARLTELPVLPRAHNGQHSALEVLRYAPDRSARMVLRLWPTAWRLDGHTDLWLGDLSRQQLVQRGRLFTLARSEPATMPELLSSIPEGLETKALTGSNPPRVLLKFSRSDDGKDQQVEDRNGQ